MKTKSILSVLLASFLFSTATIAAPAEYQFQSTYPLNHVCEVNLITPWIKTLNERAAGKFIIHEFGTGSLVNPLEADKAIESGMLDMGGWSPVRQPKIFPKWQVHTLPFLGDSSEQSTQIFWKLYDDPELKAEIESMGEHFLVFSNTVSGFFSTNTAIQKPSDLVGKRVLVLSPVDADIIMALGGIPVMIGVTEVYMGLQRGMGEVFYQALPMGYSLRAHEVAKHITVLPIYNNIMFWSMNKDLWESIPDDHKEVFKSIDLKEYSMKGAHVLDNDALNAIEVFEKAGAKVTFLNKEEKAVFKEALKPYVEDQMRLFTSNGLKDAEKWMNKAYEIAKSVPPTGKFD